MDVREEGEALEQGVEGIERRGKRPFGPLRHLLPAVGVEEAEEGKRQKLHLIKDDVAAEAFFQALEAPPRGEEEALGVGKEGRRLLNLALVVEEEHPSRPRNPPQVPGALPLEEGKGVGAPKEERPGEGEEPLPREGLKKKGVHASHY